ncbi:radical SAM protein [Polynucleobacter paneuropaeus]|nr:radical SAM protein [Polynucleobacter paneuropaeus]QWD32962.1 radical SAM protein [Polynucleobacter paneuropaeus]
MKQNKYSDYKIFHFQEKINSFIDGKITAPIYVRIKPINLCNHGCFFCVYSTGFRVKDGGEVEHIVSGMHEEMREEDVIPTLKMLEILDDLASMGTKAVTFSGGGEPLMHKDIVRIMQKTLALGLDLSIITNGQNLVKERALVLRDAKWVRVSMDYSNGEQMKRFRNVPEKSFDSVLKNIKDFAAIKSRDCDLAVNYIIHKDNHKGLYEFAKKLKDSGVENVRFSPMYVENFYDYHSEIAAKVNEELKQVSSLIDNQFSVNTTYNITPGSSHSKMRTYERCYIMQTVPVIGADLGVYACHNKAYDHTGLIGSIKDISFKALWSSPATKKIMESFNAKHKCMHECSNDRKNILINSVIDSSTDNFI